MTPTELESYVEVMRRLGVTIFKAPNIEIVLGANPAGAPPAPDDRKSLTYEQLLFSATEGLPEDG